MRQSPAREQAFDFNHTNAWLTDPIGTGEDKA
jgi:hypothetical protein